MIKKYTKLRYIKNRSIRALLIGDALVLLSVAMLAPIYALYVDGKGGDIFDVGITAAALAFGAGFASLFSGRRVDKMKNKKLLLAMGYGLLGLAFIGYIFVTNLWELAALQLVLGFINPIYSPAFDALYSEHADKDHLAEEWGAWEALSYFAGGIGAIAGGLVVYNFGFTPLFIFMASLCLFSSLYVFRLPRGVL